jgi:hypothetical protein
MNDIDETYLSERYILFVECISNETETSEKTENTIFTPYIP